MCPINYRNKLRSYVSLGGLCLLLLNGSSCNAQPPAQALLIPAKSSPVAMGCGPGNIVAGDVNNDGKVDLILACSQEKRLTIFIGQGNGAFTPSVKPVDVSIAPNEIALSDVNGDGNADLVVASHDSYGVLIVTGDGKGNFAVSPNAIITMLTGRDPHTHGLGTGDFNGDAIPDIATANNSDNAIAIMLSTSNRNWVPAPGSPFPVNSSPYPLTVGDVNRDGKLDVVSTSTRTTSGGISLLIGDGKGNFRRQDVTLRTPSPWFVAIGDINRDGKSDLAITHSERSELSILAGNSSGDFTEVAGSPFSLASSAWHVSIADMNGDANADVLAAANDGVRVMLGNGKGQFKPAPGSPFATGKGSWHLAVTDVNGDGKPDVATSNLESKSFSVLLGRGH
ncbi:VCBS repeat-containing protein [Segetibacter sp. 3557_3]|uniref:FG-GAP repeat domain-containing protein n=1 Tax=Segetibacter sp. 3557_3 TaxID=2547429 RepID=UPI0010591746|nr:VCBS repeat-containing protein [Segetibacter sp. 3557_3]TDH18395.1 VCBS repeat-containing protein [Segetibacter sp. 3557_3]